MNIKIIIGAVCVIINAFLLPLGQFFWKKSLSNGYTINILLSKYFIFGAVLYVIATMVWLYALSIFPLSKVYPFVSLSYIFGAVLGYMYLEERISYINILGYMFLIVSLLFIMYKK